MISSRKIGGIQATCSVITSMNLGASRHRTKLVPSHSTDTSTYILRVNSEILR